MRIEPLPIRRHRWGLAPLVDVVFLLLVFFMLVSSLQDVHSLAVHAPATAAGSGMEDAVLLRVLEDGRLNLDGSPVDVVELTVKIKNHLSRNPEQTVWVRPAARVPLQRLVDVLDRLHASGVRHVKLDNEET